MSLSPELQELKEELVKIGQTHLFKDENNRPIPTDALERLLKRLYSFSYTGGVVKYIENSRRLIAFQNGVESGDINGNAEEIMDIGLPERQVMFSFPSISQPAAYEGPGMMGDNRVYMTAHDVASRVPMHQPVSNKPCSLENPLMKIEKFGVECLKDVICVLVAGGLGERLNYNGIKVSLPVETATLCSYLEHYIRFFAMYGRGGSNGAKPHNKTPTGQKEMNPFIIMTSADTHKLTIQLLKEHNCFGYNSDFIYIICQEMVLCISDEKATIVCNYLRNQKGELTDVQLPMKPHGHGDVHELLYQLHDDNALTATVAINKRNRTEDSNDITLSLSVHPRDVKGDRLLDRWLGLLKPKNKWMGGNYDPYKYICFLQDTNACAPATLPYAVACMELSKDPENGYPGIQMLFGCVPRRATDAVGVFCRQNVKLTNCITKRKTTAVRVGSIEYNTFTGIKDRILHGAANSSSKKMLVAVDPEGNGIFPGSVNTIIIALEAYSHVLHLNGGTVPEFINPKYGDGGVPGSRTFKKSARLESLLQDVGLILSDMFNERVRVERERTSRGGTSMRTVQLATMNTQKTMVSSMGSPNSSVSSPSGSMSPNRNSCPRSPRDVKPLPPPLICPPEQLIGCIVFGKETFEPVKNDISSALTNEHSYKPMSLVFPSSLLKDSSEAFSQTTEETIVASAPASCACTGEEHYLNFIRDRFLNIAKLATRCADKMIVTGCARSFTSSPQLAAHIKNISVSTDPLSTIVYNKSVDSTSVISAAGGKTLPINLFPMIVYDSAFAGTLGTLATRFLSLGDTRIRMTKRSVLIINGPVRIDSLDLDGAFVINATRDENSKEYPEDIVVSNCVVRNRGWEVLSLEKYMMQFPEDRVSEMDKMRGYKIARYETAMFNVKDHKGENLVYVSGKL